MAEWKDISTAPKDGTKVLVWAMGHGHDVMFQHKNGDWDDGDFYSNETWPTHWQPLPDPPTTITLPCSGCGKLMKAPLDTMAVTCSKCCVERK